MNIGNLLHATMTFAKIFLSLLFLFCLNPLLGIQKGNPIENKYYVSICAMFRDEGKFLKEWIEYHRLAGVNHFYLYNDSSCDNYQKVLSPYVKQGVVDLIEWTRSNTEEFWIEHQMAAYDHCLKHFGHETFWLAIIDIDEFIIPVKEPNLIDYLSKFDEDERVGGIKVNWQLYGTSFVPKIKKNKLLIETLTLKAPTKYSSLPFPNNTQGKTIVRPLAVKKMGLHEANYHEGYYCLPKLSDKITKHIALPIDVSSIRINHYWTRDEAFFFGVKMNRRIQAEGEAYETTLLQKLEELNKVEDKAIFKFVPELRKRMNLD